MFGLVFFLKLFNCRISFEEHCLFIYLVNEAGEHRYCGNESQEQLASVLAQQCTEATFELLRGRSSACINCHGSFDISTTVITLNI